MKNILSTLLIIPLGLLAQWPSLDIGSTVDLNGVHMKSNGDILVSANLGMMFKSSDCGASWSEIPTGYFDDLGKIQFLNESLGYMIADDGDYAKTTDGGDTWSFSTTPAPDDLESLYFLDESLGYMVGKEGGIVRTTNGGMSWTLLPSGTNNRLHGVFFLDADHGVVAGRNQTLLKTDNGGDTWVPINSGLSGDLRNIWFTGPDNGYICAEGGLYHVNSDLSSIEFLQLGTNVEFNDIYFENANVGWICGALGAVFATNTGGVSWIEVELEGLPFEMNSIHGRALNSVFTVGDVGKLNGLCNATGLENDVNPFSDLQVNVTEGMIEVKIDVPLSQKLIQLELIDICGRTIVDESYINSSKGWHSLSKPESKGIYFVRATSGRYARTIKISTN